LIIHNKKITYLLLAINYQSKWLLAIGC